MNDIDKLVLPSIRGINAIVIHCSASPNGRLNTAADIDRWHIDRGFSRRHPPVFNPQFSAIGYHWVIRVDGTIETGRHPDEVGAHARGHNSESVGICLIGTDKFSPAQWSALKRLVIKATHVYRPKRICGHRDLPRVAKTCPGFSVRQWLDREMVPAPAHVWTGAV